MKPDTILLSVRKKFAVFLAKIWLHIEYGPIDIAQICPHKVFEEWQGSNSARESVVKGRDIVTRIENDVNRIRKTFAECRFRGVKTQLAGQRIAKAKRLKGGW